MDTSYYEQVRSKLSLMKKKLHTFYHEVQHSEQIKEETERKVQEKLNEIKEGNMQVCDWSDIGWSS